MSGLEQQRFEGQKAAPEAIAAAALEWDGKRFIGQTHGDAYLKLIGEYPEVDRMTPNVKEGFETTTGRFIDRHEAMEMADRNDQLRDNARLDGNFGLRSEDLRKRGDQLS